MVDGYSTQALSLKESSVESIDFIATGEAEINKQQSSQRFVVPNGGNLIDLAFAAMLGNEMGHED